LAWGLGGLDAVLPVSVCERMDRRRGLGVGVGWLGHLLLGGAEKRVPSPCANEFAKKKIRRSNHGAREAEGSNHIAHS
jgi:hypothetical protein